MVFFAKSAPEWTSLPEHLQHVSMIAVKFANYLGLDPDIARSGAILHDIGKVHPVFQKRLQQPHNFNLQPLRHEIASLFFLSAFPEKYWNDLIEMVVSHHKSVRKDIRSLGLLDLEEESDQYVKFHLGNWDEWSPSALKILADFGISRERITGEEAIENLNYCIDYCSSKTKEKGFSEWKGLLMGADHFASTLLDKTEQVLPNLFKQPDLTFYDRQHPLYPLSYIDANSSKKHTIVVASTGAGKTDFLFRRCRSRVFYTLPFQASINAMFRRVAKDLEENNPDLDIRVLHSTSRIIKRNNEEEPALQPLIGSSVKILTPYQLSALVFGLKGYEALLLDLRGCDVILDEVHTYTNVSQAIVLKLLEVLKSIGCRIHIGTATISSILYQKILDILGDDVFEVKLPIHELDKLDRHIIHKLSSFAEIEQIITQVKAERQKILIVLNKVKTAQDVFETIKENHPEIPSMLLHSRFKRYDRNGKERELIGIGENGESLHTFNTSTEACIVVTTQIVEVSLDISFDMMITECAPLDAMIQRFGRINRKRNHESIGKLKPIYVISPSDKESAKPYDLSILQKSFDMLEDGKTLHERDLQRKLDAVFTYVDFSEIEQHCVFNDDFSIGKLIHRSKAVLFELLEIDSVTCITEKDWFEYDQGDFESRLQLEIPTYFNSVKNLKQSDKGNRPFIIPDYAYCPEKGLDVSKIKSEIGVLL